MTTSRVSGSGGSRCHPLEPEERSSEPEVLYEDSLGIMLADLAKASHEAARGAREAKYAKLEAKASELEASSAEKREAAADARLGAMVGLGTAVGSGALSAVSIAYSARSGAEMAEASGYKQAAVDQRGTSLEAVFAGQSTAHAGTAKVAESGAARFQTAVTATNGMGGALQGVTNAQRDVHLAAATEREVAAQRRDAEAQRHGDVAQGQNDVRQAALDTMRAVIEARRQAQQTVVRG